MANVKFSSLNEALKALPYARAFQSPCDKDNEFNIEVVNKNGGNYSAFVGDDDFIGESGRGFEDVSYEDAIQSLKDALDQYDDDKIEQVYKWIF